MKVANTIVSEILNFYIQDMIIEDKILEALSDADEEERKEEKEVEKAPKDFIENIFELAFGDDAINKEYSFKDVLARIREYSDKALKYDNLTEGE